MIDKLYVMYEQGICVFEKVYFTRIDAMTDTQIFTGFLSAIGSFAAEALGSGLQAIHLQTGEKLAIMKHHSGMLGICVADTRDHDKLISSLLKKILYRFYELFKKEVDVQDASLIGKTKKFGKEVDAILKNKASSRNPWKMALGVGLGFLILTVLTFVALNRTVLSLFPGPIFITFLLDPFYMVFFGSIGESMGRIFALIMYFVAILFFLPSLLAGLLSGTRTKGLIAGLIITIGAYLTLFLAAVQINTAIGLDLRGWFLSLSPLIFFLTLSVAYCGGYITERLFLNKAPEKEKEMGRLEKALSTFKAKIGL